MRIQVIEQIRDQTIGKSIQFLASRFMASQTAQLDAQVVIADILAKPRAWILAHQDFALSPAQSDRLSQAADQVIAGTPLPYVIGHWEFFGLDFILKPSVLIPRPETELLVEESLGWLQKHPNYRTVADIGTGSGCIAISLAFHIPDLQVAAVDISKEALLVARENAARHHVSNQVTFIQSDVFDNLNPTRLKLHGDFNLIAANLPYIPSKTLRKLDVFGREPTLALNGGSDGLFLIRKLIRKASHFLAPGGVILLEIEATQGESALELTQRKFPGATIRLLPDLSGFDRLLIVQT